MIPKVGMKYRLSTKSDKSDWLLEDTGYYDFTYTIKFIGETAHPGENIILTWNPTNEWFVSEEFLDTHFIPEGKIESWKDELE